MSGNIVRTFTQALREEWSLNGGMEMEESCEKSRPSRLKEFSKNIVTKEGSAAEIADANHDTDLITGARASLVAASNAIRAAGFSDNFSRSSGHSSRKDPFSCNTKDAIIGSENLSRPAKLESTLVTDFYYATAPAGTTASTSALGAVPATLTVKGNGTNVNFALSWDASVAGASQEFVNTIAATAQQIADSLSSRYPLTVNIRIGWGTLNNAALPAGALGASSTYLYSYGAGNSAYNAFRSRLGITSSASVIDNATLSKSIPSSNPVGLTGKVAFTSAEGKALGIVAGGATGLDGFVGFAATNYLQTTGTGYDLQAVAFHELTESMGRIMMQGSSGYYTAMDLMHYSASGARMLTSKGGYLSADGVQKLGYLNAASSGDAGDWASPTAANNYNLKNDYANAFASPGPNTLSPNNWFTMDALGWNLAAGSGLNNTSIPTYV